MAEPSIPQNAKLFIGILYSNELTLARAEQALKKKFGEIDYQTRPIAFDHTSYYTDISHSLKKVFYSFKKLIRREEIVAIKLYTNKLETRLSPKGLRSINIDPGYLTLSNVFLATCKEYFHRTYLSRGVFLENEYHYIAKKFQPWDWTYPDYRKPEYLYFFHEIRRIYYIQIRNHN